MAANWSVELLGSSYVRSCLCRCCPPLVRTSGRQGAPINEVRRQGGNGRLLRSAHIVMEQLGGNELSCACTNLHGLEIKPGASQRRTDRIEAYITKRLRNVCSRSLRPFQCRAELIKHHIWPIQFKPCPKLTSIKRANAERRHFSDSRKRSLKGKECALPMKIKPSIARVLQNESRTTIPSVMSFVKQCDHAPVMIRAYAMKDRAIDKMVDIHSSVSMPREIRGAGQFSDG